MGANSVVESPGKESVRGGSCRESAEWKRAVKSPDGLWSWLSWCGEACVAAGASTADASGLVGFRIIVEAVGIGSSRGWA
jgi:hypothetical protein